MVAFATKIPRISSPEFNVSLTYYDCRYIMEKVDFVFVGAEGVVESGGIINKVRPLVPICIIIDYISALIICTYHNVTLLIYCLPFSQRSASALSSVMARIMTCQCFRSSATSVVIWFLAISSLTRSRHLSFSPPPMFGE